MTESTIPRKPGRPKGSSRLNQSDALLCQQVADKVLRNPSLTDRAAILQVIGSDNPAGLRRLQGKFHREEMVAAAKARARADEQARQAAAQRNLDGMRLALDSVFVVQQAMRNIAASPFMQNIERIMQDSERMRREAVFAWMKVQQSPFMQNIERIMQDSERMRRGGVFAWMKVQQSPCMQALDALQKAEAFSAWPGLPARPMASSSAASPR